MKNSVAFPSQKPDTTTCVRPAKKPKSCTNMVLTFRGGSEGHHFEVYRLSKESHRRILGRYR